MTKNRDAHSNHRSALPGIVLVMMFCGCSRSTPHSPVSNHVVSARVSPSEESSLHPPLPRAIRPDDWFEDVTASSGVDWTYNTGRDARRNTILETVGGGAGLIDFDLDTRLDVYSPGGGAINPVTGLPSGIPGKLFQQADDGRFTDVTVPAGLATDGDYSHGIVAGDFDQDGFSDLLMTCYGVCKLWRNHGDGTFSDVAKDAGISVRGWHTAAAWADMNGDGNLDLFMADYVNWGPSEDVGLNVPSDVPPPQRFAPLSDHLFMNLGDGRFEDASERAGIRLDGMGLGVVAADLNDDGAADLYVANDVVGNHLYLGTKDFPLREVAEISGTAYNESGSPEGSMGVDAEDVNGDGLPDLWVTNFELEDNSLYLNLGDNLFQHSTVRFGLAGMARTLVGFGTGFQDFDGDGWADLYVLNGHVQYHSPRSPFRQPALILRNDSGRRFIDMTAQAGPWFSIPHAARGGAAGDWNNDGAVDLVISSLDEPLTLLRNRLEVRPNLRLRLVGVRSPREPVGATVQFEFESRTIVRLVKSGAGYLSQSDPRIIVPLERTAKTIEFSIRWPGGLRERFRIPARPGDVVLVEDRGVALD